MVLETMEAKLDDFNQVFQKFRSDEATKKHLKFILFLADKDPMTSRSWCPDCNVAEPIIYQRLEEANSDIALLKVYVGDRPTWYNPSHRFRADPRFRIQGVPTLIRWENDGITGRLEDYEAHVDTKIDALLSDK
jgi:thiol-disulfide isomerase/thioredoxin